MKSTQKKTGRKPKSFVTADNRTIDGLCRQPDGRWRITAPAPTSGTASRNLTSGWPSPTTFA